MVCAIVHCRIATVPSETELFALEGWRTGGLEGIAPRYHHLICPHSAHHQDARKQWPVWGQHGSMEGPEYSTFETRKHEAC